MNMSVNSNNWNPYLDWKVAQRESESDIHSDQPLGSSTTPSDPPFIAQSPRSSSHWLAKLIVAGEEVTRQRSLSS